MLRVLDSTNLVRHLTLAAPVLRLQIATLIVLNMADDFKRRGGKVDAVSLSRELGCPVALVSATRGDGVEKVVQFLSGVSARRTAPPNLVQLPVIQLLGFQVEAGILLSPVEPESTRQLQNHIQSSKAAGFRGWRAAAIAKTGILKFERIGTP